MNILFIGDTVGKASVACIKRELVSLRQHKRIDFVIANGENIADGLGINKRLTRELKEAGVNAVTLGNHTWAKMDFVKDIELFDYVIRPSNVNPTWKGRGYRIFKVLGKKIAIVNLIGQIYMAPADSPFREIDRILDELFTEQVNIIIVDFHAEATAEKIAFAYYVANKVSLVCGTHTHVQTADERIINGHMGFISDVGMTGPYDSIIGMEVDCSLRRFVHQLPSRYRIQEGRQFMSAIYAEIDNDTGICKHIERIQTKAL